MLDRSLPAARGVKVWVQDKRLIPLPDQDHPLLKCSILDFFFFMICGFKILDEFRRVWKTGEGPRLSVGLPTAAGRTSNALHQLRLFVLVYPTIITCLCTRPY